MNTLLIYTDFASLPQLFFFEEDLTRFNGLIVKHDKTPLVSDFCSFMFDAEGYIKHKEISELHLAAGKPLSVVRCGFV